MVSAHLSSNIVTQGVNVTHKELSHNQSCVGIRALFWVFHEIMTTWYCMRQLTRVYLFPYYLSFLVLNTNCVSYQKTLCGKTNNKKQKNNPMCKLGINQG